MARKLRYFDQIGKVFTSSPAYTLRVLRNRIRRRLVPDYYLYGRKGYCKKPQMIKIELTHHCNLSCRMCGFFGRKDHEGLRKGIPLPEKALTLEQLKKFVDDITVFTPFVGYSGAEPTLHPDYLDLALHIKKKGLFFGFPTNGTLLEGKAEEIVETGLDWLTISLDGPEEIHDKVRGVPGTFKKLTAGVKKIQEVKIRKKLSTPHINFNFTFCGDNYRYLEEMILIAIRMGANGISISHLFYWAEEVVKAHNHTYGADFPFYPLNNEALKDLDPKQVASVLEKIKQANLPVPINIFPDINAEEIEIYYREPSRFVKTRRCKTPWLTCNLLPNGDLIPCLDYVVGNIHEQSFSEIWNGECFKKFRTRLHQAGTFPACSRCGGLFGCT